jgi:hypothetical protein
MDVCCDPISCLGYVFLMVGFEWRLLVKDNMDRGKSVYNRNVTLDVDPKCILVVQIYKFLLFFLQMIQL